MFPNLRLEKSPVRCNGKVAEVLRFLVAKDFWGTTAGCRVLQKKDKNYGESQTTAISLRITENTLQ